MYNILFYLISEKIFKLHKFYNVYACGYTCMMRMGEKERERESNCILYYEKYTICIPIPISEVTIKQSNEHQTGSRNEKIRIIHYPRMETLISKPYVHVCVCWLYDL